MGIKREPGELSPYSRAWAAEIRGERGAQGMTQSEIAKRSGLSLSTIGRIEKEERDIDADQMWKICQALGITVLELATRAERRVAAQSRRGNGRRAAGG